MCTQLSNLRIVIIVGTKMHCRYEVSQCCHQFGYCIMDGFPSLRAVVPVSMKLISSTASEINGTQRPHLITAMHTRILFCVLITCLNLSGPHFVIIGPPGTRFRWCGCQKWRGSCPDKPEVRHSHLGAWNSIWIFQYQEWPRIKTYARFTISSKWKQISYGRIENFNLMFLAHTQFRYYNQLGRNNQTSFKNSNC